MRDGKHAARLRLAGLYERRRDVAVTINGTQGDHVTDQNYFRHQQATEQRPGVIDTG